MPAFDYHSKPAEKERDILLLERTDLRDLDRSPVSLSSIDWQEPFEFEPYHQAIRGLLL